jgi:membrane protease YdiL (CAAX protease family)
MTLAPAIRRAPLAATAATIAGCVALAARPLIIGSTADVVLLFALLLAVGTLWPLPARYSATTWHQIAPAIGVGVVAFGLGRVIGGGHPPIPFAAKLIALNSLAAVAEEAFFRRLVFGALERHGAAVAISGSTVLFALVHVTVYGWWVLPLDLAAGAVFSWQRWATGRWSVPAVTHVIANVLVVL